MLDYVLSPDKTCAIVLAVGDDTTAPVRCISQALRTVYTGYAVSVVPILHRWFAAFVRTGPVTVPEFVEEAGPAVRLRFETMLLQAGCRLRGNHRGPRGLGRKFIERPGKSASEITVFVNALTEFYAALRERGARSAANPLLIDNCEDQVAILAAELKADRRRPPYRRQFLSLSRYITRAVRPAAPIIADPCAVAEQILAAGEACGWPPAVSLVFTIMAENGCRISEACFPTAWHWWKASKFGRTILTRNGKSKNAPEKYLILSDQSHARLVRLFEERSPECANLPNFAELQYLARTDEKALRRIPLFPSRRGTALSTGSLRNTYFRPAMRKAHILADYGDAAKRPTPHLLRHAYVTHRVRILDQEFPNDTDFEAALRRLAEDLSCSGHNIYRYAEATIRQRKLARRFKVAQSQREVIRDVLGNHGASLVQQRLKRMQARAA